MASRDSSRRFHFLKEIASGGFGSVYLAKVMHADGFSRLAAIKLLHQRWSENAEIAQRMRDEARLLGWLRHRNIVDVIDLTTIGGRVAVIMEYLEAIDFKGAVSHVAEVGERMPPRAALDAVAFVASALDAAYNRPPYQGEKPLRVIHRDIKPSNIMVDESGTVKVLDFGVARADFDHRESHTQELQFGSVDYMPPERLFFEPETPFSDVYSLGATLYELLALEKLGKAKGRPEKHAQFLHDRMEFLRSRCDLDGISGDAVIDLLLSMLAYNHEHRPPAAEVVQRCRALARGFEGEGITEWAERVIPPLVKANREAPREPNPLTDSILSEDSATFKAEDTYVEPVGGVVLSADDSVPAEIPKSDARWDLLRQAALQEMSSRDPASNFADGPTRVDRSADDIEVIDETGSDHTVLHTPAMAERALLPPSSVTDAPSAPFVRKANAPLSPAQPPAAPADARTPSSSAAMSPLPAVGGTGPSPASPTPPAASRAVAPAAAPPPPTPDRPSVAPSIPPPVPSTAHRPTAAAAAAALRASPTMIPDDPRPPPAGPLPDDPSAFGEEKTVVGGGGTSQPPAAWDETLPGAQAGRSTPPAASSDPPVRPFVQEPPRPPGPRPAPPAPRPPADVFDEPAPPRRSWLVPALVGVLFLVIGGGGAAVVVGGALLSGQGVSIPGVSAPAAPVPATPAAPPPQAAAAAAPASVEGGLNFVSAVPGTSRITASCDGVEVSGTDRVGLAGPTAKRCSVKVVLEDRSRLFAEIEAPEAGTWRCFEGGAKTCVR